MPSQYSQGGGQSPAINIAVMGETGSGKSSFIKRVTGRRDVNVGHGINRGTYRIQPYEVTLKSPENGRSYRVRLIDCPGFDDISVPDRQTVDDILLWLRDMYGENRKLHGIIYTINIDRPRVTGFAMRNIAVFRELVGNDFYPNVVLGTTFWDRLSNELEGTEREQELKSTPGFWGQLAARGSQIRRIGNQGRQAESSTTSRHRPSASDLSVVYEIVRNFRPQWVAAQEEMAYGFSPSQTSASREFDEWEHYWKAVRRMEEDHDRARRESERRVSDNQTQLNEELRRRKDMSTRLRPQDIEFATDEKRRRKLHADVLDLKRQLSAVREASEVRTNAELERARELRKEKQQILAAKKSEEAATLVKSRCKQFRQAVPAEVRCQSSDCRKRHAIRFKVEDYYRKSQDETAANAELTTTITVSKQGQGVGNPATLPWHALRLQTGAMK
ncbi:uncharacterized protein HMPREF1541_10498 [Cyphellophora europaea CBS 101466]|uniref:G domain-containing protein n=1 Tax=Cyphellophora europaea (strain CBS 101466) TaxID=1220924 RepID=W2S8D9_CYPE1|nr:uncharacterized protein HMPREF1541_10498 [Cyphellophora europaea CBS 101466]ETN44318.1 hypothetical protein HMPREF1541_10498 [Cyphellophora europaea CBS 101466]